MLKSYKSDDAEHTDNTLMHSLVLYMKIINNQRWYNIEVLYFLLFVYYISYNIYILLFVYYISYLSPSVTLRMIFSSVTGMLLVLWSLHFSITFQNDYSKGCLELIFLFCSQSVNYIEKFYKNNIKICDSRI